MSYLVFQEMNSPKRSRGDSDFQAADDSSRCSSNADDSFVVPNSVVLEDTSNTSTSDDQKERIGLYQTITFELLCHSVHDFIRGLFKKYPYYCDKMNNM